MRTYRLVLLFVLVGELLFSVYLLARVQRLADNHEKFRRDVSRAFVDRDRDLFGTVDICCANARATPIHDRLAEPAR